MIRYYLEYSYAEHFGSTWSETKERKILLEATTDEEADKEARALFGKEDAEAKADLEALKKSSGNSKIDDFGLPRNAYWVRRTSL